MIKKQTFLITILVVLLSNHLAMAEFQIKNELGLVEKQKASIETLPETQLGHVFDDNLYDSIMITHASGQLQIMNSMDYEKSKIEVLNEVSKKDCEFEYKIKNKILHINTGKKIFVVKNDCDQNLKLSIPKTKKINVSLGTGILNIIGIFPLVKASLGFGDVNIQGEISKLDLDVASGSVTVSGLEGYGKITLLSGDLDVEYDEQTKTKFNQLHVSKSVGNTRIKIPKGATAESKLKTLLGKISNNIVSSDSGKFYFSVKTNVGDIKMETND